MNKDLAQQKQFILSYITRNLEPTGLAPKAMIDAQYRKGVYKSKQKTKIDRLFSQKRSHIYLDAKYIAHSFLKQKTQNWEPQISSQKL